MSTSPPLLQIEWTFTWDDVRRDVLADRSWRRLAMRICGLAFSILTCLSLIESPDWFTGIFGLAVGLTYALWPYSMLLFLRTLFGTYYWGDSHPELCRMHMEFHQDGLRYWPCGAPGSPQFLHWSRLRTITRDDLDYHLSFTGNRRIHFPVVSFANEQDEERFRGLVDQHLPNALPAAG
jgi:hypothetical protein